jgi:hypothetical protein
MKKIIICLLLSTSVGFVNAQLKDLMMKKVGDKVTKNKSEKKSTTTSTSTDSSAKDNSNTETQHGGFNPFMSGGKKEILPQYTFNQNVLMDMKSYDKKGNLEEKKSSQMRWHFSTEPYNAIEPIDKENGGTSFSIFDSKKSQMVSLMDSDGNKMAMVTKIDAAKVQQKAAENTEKSGVKIVKTGRTKKICGYNCEEWVSTDEKGRKSEMWISQEVPIILGGSFSMFGSQNPQMANNLNAANYPKGYMMEITNYDTNGEKFIMTAVEVNLKAEKVISTAGYTVY